MLTREQILEVQTYCAEHKVSQNDRLDELKIDKSQFYRWQRKYRREDEQGLGPEAGAEEQSFLTIELRTASGTAMRIQGSMTAAHLREIIAVK